MMAKLSDSTLHPIEQHLADFFKSQTEAIVVSYSGGVDSQVLLHALAKLKQSGKLVNDLAAIHVHHGLSKHADSWAQFCQKNCQQLAISHQILTVSIAKQSRKSLEAIAREARYQAIKQAIDCHTLLVTGHHAHDQFETFLLALKRGSGVSGLKAMKDKSTVFGLNVCRPLLSFCREQIENYARLHKLEWIEDESNTDEKFDRNFIRHQITPKLNKRWPQFLQQVHKTTEHLSQAEQLLAELAQIDFKQCCENSAWGSALNINKLLQLSAARFNNLIRYWLQMQQQLMPSTAQLAQIRQQLQSNEHNQLTVKLSQCCIRRYKHQLLVTPIFTDVTHFEANFSVAQLAKTVKVDLPDELGALLFSLNNEQVTHVGEDHSQQICIKLKPPKLGQNIQIRFTHQNPVCLPEYRQHHRALKKVLQELNIPTWMRERIPFLYYDNELVAAIGFFRCQGFMANDQDELIISWQK